MAQLIIGLVFLAALVGVTYAIYVKRKNEMADVEYIEARTVESLVDIVKAEMTNLLKTDEMLIVNKEYYAAVTRNKRRIDLALTECVHGVESAKAYVLALIRNVIERELPSYKDACELLSFDYPAELLPMVKFEILLYKLSRKHGKDVIQYLDEKYHFTELREVEAGDNFKKREVDFRFLDRMFFAEVSEISYADALDILSVLVFQKYKGYGCIDTLRAMNIDGLEFGTSGSVRFEIDGNYDARYRSVNSVWIQIRAKWVHFSFLDFYRVGEMKRVANQLVSYGMAAPMTEKKSYKVTDGPDGSRITAIRPSAGEGWAIFIRKFTLSIYSMSSLLNKPRIHNWQLPAKLIYYLMQAEQTCAFTGQQNTGKTTLMKSAIECIPVCNIRVLEMSFELALREIYPHLNIFTVKPTDYVSSSQLQDTLKKTDGYLSMVGEVAEDIVAARMIQFCLIASAFTMFSHHGKDDPGLITGLTNSLVASGEYSDHTVAMATVLDAIKNNIHLDFVNGERVIEYISEIIKEDEVMPYPSLHEGLTDTAWAIVQMTKIQREFYTRTTDRVRFTSKRIIVFNKKTMTYEANEWYSPEAYERILKKLPEELKQEFRQFYADNWRGAR